MPIVAVAVFAIGFSFGLLLCVAPSSPLSAPLLAFLMFVGRGYRVGSWLSSRNGIRASGILIMLLTAPVLVAAFLKGLQ